MSSIGDIAEVIVLFQDTANASFYECTFGFECIATPTDLGALASAFKTALVKSTSGGLLYFVPSTIVSNQITVRDVVPGTAAPYLLTYSNVVGNLAGQALPPQDATVFTLRTALAGRSFRGRFYLPGPSESQQSGGLIDSGSMALADTISVQLLAVFGPSGSNGDWQCGVISRVAGGNPRVTPIITPIVTVGATNIIRSQRRRQIGRGS